MRTLAETVLVFVPLLAAYAGVAAWGNNGLLAGLAAGLPATLLSLGLATRVLTRTGSGWRALGLVRPPRTGRFILWTVATIVVVGASIGIIQNLLLFLGLGGPSGGDRLAMLSGNRALLLLGIVGVWMVSAFGEEMLFRGFLLDRLLRAVPAGKSGTQAAVILSALLFGLAHLPHGGRAVVFSGVAGIGYASLYIGSGRWLWVPIVAHGVIDTLAILAYVSAAGVDSP